MNVYVPYRASAWRPQQRRTVGVPYRGGFAGLGAGSNLVSSAGKVYSGATAGALVAAGTTVSGAVAGAAAGSFVPIIGTAIGAVLGLALSGVFSHRADPEVANFNAAVQLFNSQGVNGIMNIANKYLVLAGLFDLQPSQIKGNIPIYKKYGRMGEEKFTADMVNLIYNAAQAGKITANDTVQSVYNNIVAPWIASFGYGSMSDANGEMITNIIIGLIAEYITGLWKQRWFSRSGPMPATFNSLPTFALPAASTQTMATSAAVPPVTPVASVPTVALPTNSTPGPPAAVAVYGSPDWFASQGYQLIGADPTYGNVYGKPGTNAAPLVLINGQVAAYPQQIPSVASQLPSVGTPATTAPIQSAAPSVAYAPPVQYQGGGIVPVTPTDTSTAVQPQAAGVLSSTNPWIIGGAVAVALALMMSMGRNQNTPARRA